MHVSTNTHVEIAATVGSIISLKELNILLVRVVALPPATKMEMTTSSKDVRNANSPAENSENLICGSVIVKKAMNRLAPRLAAIRVANTGRNCQSPEGLPGK